MSNPHKAALGTPMAHSPSASRVPTVTFTAAWETR